MATVYLGSAHGDERGQAYGGQAGDQTGREVSVEKWYKHSKSWRVFRCKNAEKAKKIAQCMQMACDNNHIGYDQWQRNSLYSAAKPYDFDVSKVTTNVETDCSALVRVCCAYAGIMLSDFNTAMQPQILANNPEFVELVGSEYTTRPDNLKAGDILVTATKGHTVVVMNDATSAATSTPTSTSTSTKRVLRNGMKGQDVKELQIALISLGYDCGRWGADGDFGDGTEFAVRKFQFNSTLEPDGIVGTKTWTALEKAIAAEEKEDTDVKQVEFLGNCYIRKEPNAQSESLGVALKGDILPYGGQTIENWHLIKYKAANAWVSATYGKLVK